MHTRIDYLVVTYPDNPVTDAMYPVLLSRVADGRNMAVRGYVGRAVDGLYIGRSTFDNRVMVSSTGSSAGAIAAWLPRSLDNIASIARIDVQATFTSLDADAEIMNIGYSPVYKAVRYQDLKDRGVTLYVGAPTSRVRLRIYNKSAESGIRPDAVREYIRYEVQFRDKVADEVWQSYRNNQLDERYLHQLKKMLDKVNYERVRKELPDIDPETYIKISQSEKTDWAGRRMVWLSSIVIPAVNRLLIERPDLAKEVKAELDRIMQIVYNIGK